LVAAFGLSCSSLYLQLGIPNGLITVALIMCVNIAPLFSGTMREYRAKVIGIKFVIMDVAVEAGCPYLRIRRSPRFFKI